MYTLTALSANLPLIMAISAWLIAQLCKFILTFIINRNDLSLKVLLASGGMPSSHSATVCALTTAIALNEGLASPLFAICAVLSFIVMYDAMGVRRSAGEQAQTLNQIIEQLLEQKQISVDTAVREIFGHTPFQVVIGAGLGILLPIAAKFLFQA